MAAKGRLLLVEDDHASRTALQYLLKRGGWNVQAVVTVAEAIRAVSDSPPQAIVLDLMLPDGDGLDVLRAVRSAKLNACVVLITGVNDPEWLLRAKNLIPTACCASRLIFHS